MPLNVMASTSVSSFYKPTRAYAAGYEGARIDRVDDVAVARLDEVFDDVVRGSRVFLKIDTQGSDLEVLSGATSALPHVHGLQIELSVMAIYTGTPDYVEALQVISAHGFTPSGFFPVERDDALRAYEFDGVFVRSPSRPARARHEGAAT
jgi:hypothetical protein